MVQGSRNAHLLRPRPLNEKSSFIYRWKASKEVFLGWEPVEFWMQAHEAELGFYMCSFVFLVLGIWHSTLVLVSWFGPWGMAQLFVAMLRHDSLLPLKCKLRYFGGKFRYRRLFICCYYTACFKDMSVIDEMWSFHPWMLGSASSRLCNYDLFICSTIHNLVEYIMYLVLGLGPAYCRRHNDTLFGFLLLQIPYLRVVIPRYKA